MSRPVDMHLHIPEPGHEYRHYKGGVYRVIAIGRLSEQRDQVMVVYRSEDRGLVWIRPLGMWSELVHWPDLADNQPRFMRFSEYGERVTIKRERDAAEPF